MADMDIEKSPAVDDHLGNADIQSFSWKEIRVLAGSQREDTKQLQIIANVNGVAQAGRLTELSVDFTSAI